MDRVRVAVWGLAMAVSSVAHAEPRLAREQILHRGGSEPVTLDPHRAEDVGTADVLRDLFQGLTDTAANGDIEPGVAERWVLSDDGRTYTFYLRKDARWSNGEPLIAEDFVEALRRSADPATGSNYSSVLAPIENATAVTAGQLPPSALAVSAFDAHTLLIRLKAPTPYFLGLLTHSTTYPVYRPALKQHGKNAFRPEHVVGNGAYRLQEWRRQSYVRLARNTHYWDNANTTVEQVYYHVMEDASSEFKRYRAGELDWTGGIPATQLHWIRQNIPNEFHTAPYLGIYYLAFNLTQPPFKNQPALRQALTMAIDRPVIVQKLLKTNQSPAYNWVPPVTQYQPQLPTWASWSREQQLAEARRLYAKAGYSKTKPLRVELRYNTSEDHKKIMVVIAAMWKQFLGVETTLINEEFKVFLKNRAMKKDTQVFRSGWIGDYNDAFTFMEILQSKSGNNDTGYANPIYDALVERAAVEPNLQTRQQLLQEAEQQLLNDQPILPLYFYVSKRLVKPWVVGWQGNSMDHHPTRHFKILAH